MSANIQFMETGNLPTPDKGDMSGFCFGPPCIRQVRWRRGRFVAGRGGPASHL